MKNFLICGNSSKPMKLNESESTSDRYILQGLFAGPFGVENRNKRIYEVDEYLKHLQYLRDDIKKVSLCLVNWITQTIGSRSS